jgi:N-acetylglucosaminyl-diphospho-decaprenol L-rhamnosyltransferase
MNDAAGSIVAVEPAVVRDLPGALSARRVSVVMVVYRTGEALAKSLACALADPLVDELIVVDNGSTLEEAAHIKGLVDAGSRVKLISGQGNVGFARGANLGAKAASGDILIFLNPDAFLQPGCVAALADEAEAHPAPCVVGGRILNADGTEQRGARRGEITPMSAVLSLSGLAKARGLRRHEVHRENEALPDAPVAAPTISGACFCMRSADFAMVGGFDEGYFLHVEDVDLCWRVRRAGGSVLFHPKAEVVHLGHTSKTSPVKVEFHKGVGLARYFRKRADSGAQLAFAWALSPLIVLSAVVRPLVRGLRG